MAGGCEGAAGAVPLDSVAVPLATGAEAGVESTSISEVVAAGSGRDWKMVEAIRLWPVFAVIGLS